MKDRDPMEKTEQAGHSHHERVHSKRRHRAGDPHSEGASAGPQVIARIPRLPKNDDFAVPEKSTGDGQGRLLGRRLSTWALVGGVGFLVVAALLVPKAFQSKSSSEPGTQEAASQSEGPAPNAPPAPRWAAPSPTPDALPTTTASANPAFGADSRSGAMPDVRGPTAAGIVGQGGTYNPSPDMGARPNESPYAVGSAADASIARANPSWSGPTYANPPAQAVPSAPWQPVPGARRPDIVNDGPGSNDSIPQGRPAVDPYRAPSRGGLVNAQVSAPRDYSSPPPPVWGDAYTTMATSPRENYAADPRADYRTAARQRYGQDAAPLSADERRVAYPESLPSANYSNPPARPNEMARDAWSSGYRNDGAAGGYPNRGQTAGYETTSSGSGRAVTAGGAMPPRNNGTPDWVAPPNWVTPPSSAGNTWATPPAWASPQSAPPASPSYPATGYSGSDNGPTADPSAGGVVPGAVAPGDYQAARFEGTIDRPTARDSYERTRPSIR